MSKKPSEIDDLLPVVADDIAAMLGIHSRQKRPWTRKEQDRIRSEFNRPGVLFRLQTDHSPRQQ
jgi:hypothetical protein